MPYFEECQQKLHDLREQGSEIPLEPKLEINNTNYVFILQKYWIKIKTKCLRLHLCLLEDKLVHQLNQYLPYNCSPKTSLMLLNLANFRKIEAILQFHRTKVQNQAIRRICNMLKSGKQNLTSSLLTVQHHTHYDTERKIYAISLEIMCRNVESSKTYPKFMEVDLSPLGYALATVQMYSISRIHVT